jgi:hypothetical protein
MAAKIFTDIEKECVWQWLALGFGPQQIVDFVSEDFGKKCTRQTIHDHLKNHAEKIAKLREEIKANLDCIPFARKEQRVAYLDRLAHRQFKKRGQEAEFRATLKQIAEEMGALVQKHELTGKDGKPIETRNMSPEDLSIYTQEELLAMRTIHETAHTRRNQPGTSEPES